MLARVPALRLLVLSAVALYPASAVSAPLGDDAGTAPPEPRAVSPAPAESPAPTLRLGGFLGVLTDETFAKMLYEPWLGHLQDSYLAGVHVVGTLYGFASVPLDLEIEAGIAQRFADDHQTELYLIPMGRWKRFPWNDCLYTNLRLGVIGASYVSGISAWEMHRGSGGSRYLNLVVPEITFAASAHAPYEIFLRIHHRSGAFGAVNGVYGGSSYFAVGVRFVAR